MRTYNNTELQALPHNVTHGTDLACDCSRLWAAIARMDQINFELMPYLRMTVPREARHKSIEDAPLNQRAFTSVILLFGVVPVDLHFVHLTEMERGHKFVETSFTLVNATWRHERTIDALPDGQGSRITDRISFRTRLPLLGRLLTPLVRVLFAHRHRRLLARFGASIARPAHKASEAPQEEPTPTL
jgi:hypothetical protein